MNIGKIERVALREIWKHEALDFTTWLVENIEVISDVVDIDLNNPEREQAAGSFNVDIVAEDDFGNRVVIENQLERSDHDHLGKLITYLAVQDAKVAIWIVSEPRPEHIAAINWLNESGSASFYLLKLEGVRIGDSHPAPLITNIVGPSEEIRQIGESKKELSERHLLRRDFWSNLLENAREKTSLHANISPSSYSWIGTGAGISGLSYNYSIRQYDGRVELYIYTKDDDRNSQIFDFIYEKREEIDEKFGTSLNWQKLEAKRACRISYQTDGGYRDDEAQWNTIHDDMINAMIRLESALSPRIRQLR